MPLSRLARRRRSSLAHTPLVPARAGVYGITMHPLSSRPVTFAPNITPVSYVESTAADSPDDAPTPAAFSPDDTSRIFPPSASPAPPPTRRRCPPGKRRSMGYIPRPPNAFMLFRADFVRQKHVPGSIETNHGSLSKIIGNCWRALPLEEKKYWEREATKAKAAHKIAHPDYRFRPVHNKNKDKGVLVGKKTGERRGNGGGAAAEEVRCEEVAQLLLEGKKGDELAQAVRMLDDHRRVAAAASSASSATPSPLSTAPSTLPPMMYQPQPSYHPSSLIQHRRSSSVPLPPHAHPTGGITLPSLPFFNSTYSSRAHSPVNSISRMAYTSSTSTYPPYPHQLEQQQDQQHSFGITQRRASSVGLPDVPNPWFTYPTHQHYNPFAQPLQQQQYSIGELQRDDSPLPEADTSLFEPSFLGDAFPSSSSSTASEEQSALSSSSSTTAATGSTSSNFDFFDFGPSGQSSEYTTADLGDDHKHQHQQVPGVVMMPLHGDSIDPACTIAPDMQVPMQYASLDMGMSMGMGMDMWTGMDDHHQQYMGQHQQGQGQHQGQHHQQQYAAIQVHDLGLPDGSVEFQLASHHQQFGGEYDSTTSQVVYA